MSTKEFGEDHYWEKKYQEKEEEYEWYQPWAAIKSYVLPFLKGNQSQDILNVGCGNSPMGVDMLNEGFNHIVNIDISNTVIEQMKKRYLEEKRCNWISMDCTQLEFKENTFDAVIEKGTIDALVCKKDQGSSIHKFLEESYRVLRDGGVFLSISFGKPSLRLNYYREVNLKWQVQDPIEIPKIMIPNQYYYLFVAIKEKV